MFYCGAFRRRIVSNNQSFNIINVVSSSFAQDKPRQDVEATPWGTLGSSVLFYMVKMVNFGL